MWTISADPGDGEAILPPFDVAACEPGPALGSARQLAAATWAFVALGVLVRVIRYALDFPLWGDEAFLAINFLDRGYGGVFRPLEYGQICPLLFFWIELTAVRLIGFSEWSLRLFPLLCGVASLFLFRHAAGRVVRGLPLLLAVGFLAVSVHPIRHATDAKPYASDLLAALVLIAPALEWLRARPKTSWLWVLAAVAPVALALSQPAVFVAGGIALGLAIPVVKAGRWRAWLPFAVYVLGMAASFFLLYALITGEQSRGTVESYRRGYWAASFPPLGHPARLPLWFLDMNTGTMFAYPWGGPSGASGATTVCFTVAAVFLWRSGRRAVLLTLLGPFLLALVAAALGRYPYGHAARQMQFVAPAICLLGGLGAAILLRAIPWPGLRPWLVGGVPVVLALLGLIRVATDVSHPYRFRSDPQARDFARRFWPAQERDADVACVRQDFGVVNRHSLNLRTALHVCNREIYSPRRRRGEGLRRDRVSRTHPLRCVLYHETPPGIPEVVAWMARMGSEYDVSRSVGVEVDMSGVSAGPRRERWLVIDFVPKAARPTAAVAGRPAATGLLRTE